MRNIILASLAAGLIIAGASTAEAKSHHGHVGHGGHRGGFSGGHHGGHHNPFSKLRRCGAHYGWHTGHYRSAYVCPAIVR